jgi:hypothetical protein
MSYQPFHLLVVAPAGRLERHHQAIIDYLNRRESCSRSNSKVSDFGSPMNGGYDWS